MSNYKINLHKIKAFAFDVDGVFTDGSLLVDNDGHFLRIYNAKDGYAVRQAVLQDYHIAIITGGAAASIKHRFNDLGVKDIFLLSENKIQDFTTFCIRRNINADEVLFMGDDIPDIEIMQTCGISCCPADAVPEVKNAAMYISEFDGGKGCVRDVIEQVMKIQGKWNINANKIKSE
ncbi:MAG: HAD-IIIA family hydrolase [Prevotellaceae bacterium]|jgi:3-deoxy-D-manno-octulosonate 8-phosphate phosphatase (KDO 8-P phosphatase)|nr:HAD-IIIA family hydrolase [Prevotellaceae bacterium]